MDIRISVDGMNTSKTLKEIIDEAREASKEHPEDNVVLHVDHYQAR